MTVSKDIALNVLGSIGAYQREIAKLEGVTQKEAKKAALSLQKELTKAEVKAAKIGTNTGKQFSKGVGKGLKGAQDAAGETDSIIAALGGAIGQINPKLEGMARVGADAAGGLEAILRSGAGLAGPIGVVTVAVGAGALAWKHFADEIEEAEARMEAASQAATAMQAATASFGKAIDLAELEAAVALGEEDLQALQGRMALERAQNAAAATLAEQKKKIADTEARIRDTRRELEDIKGTRDEFRYTTKLQREEVALNAVLKAQKEIMEGTIRRTDVLAGAYLEATAGADRFKKSLSDSAVEDEVDALRDLHTELARVREEAARAASDDPKLYDYEQEIASLETLKEAGIAAGEDTAAVDQRIWQLREDAWDHEMQMTADLANAELAAAQERKASEEAINAASEKGAEARRQQLVSLIQMAAQIAGMVRDILAELGIEIENENVKKGLNIGGKLLGIGSAALGVAALASGVGAPAAAPLLAASAATGAGSGFLQGFHAGGSIDRRPLAPDEQMRTLTKQETVVTHEEALPDPRPIVIENHYGHRTLDVVVRDNHRRGGSLRRLTRAKRVGHSGVRNG